MDTFNVSLTLEQVRVIQDCLEDKIDSWENFEPVKPEDIDQALAAQELFTEVFGPIIASCRNI